MPPIWGQREIDARASTRPARARTTLSATGLAAGSVRCTVASPQWVSGGLLGTGVALGIKVDGRWAMRFHLGGDGGRHGNALVRAVGGDHFAHQEKIQGTVTACPDKLN
jgi:hypothetical protein